LKFSFFPFENHDNPLIKTAMPLIDFLLTAAGMYLAFQTFSVESFHATFEGSFEDHIQIRTE